MSPGHFELRNPRPRAYARHSTHTHTETTTPAMDLPEPPECPVCLQPYDGASATPRVLPCGHSACETCLSLLPQPFPHTIRCPACTQLVKCSHPQSLPKNIDLLRFASLFLNPDPPNPQKPNEKRSNPITDRQFVPNLWSNEFYLTWKIGRAHV